MGVSWGMVFLSFGVWVLVSTAIKVVVRKLGGRFAMGLFCVVLLVMSVCVVLIGVVCL